MSVNLHDIPDLERITVNADVQLRPLEKSDAARILEILAVDPSIRKVVSAAANITDEESYANELAAIAADDGLIRYALVVNGRVEGIVSFWRDSGYFGNKVNPKQYGFGYFVDPAMRGRGLTVSAVKAVMEIAVTVLDVESFVGYCYGDNLASMTVLEKCGFTRVKDTSSRPLLKSKDKMYIRTL